MAHCPDCYMGGEGAWDCGHEAEIARLTAERDAGRADLKSKTEMREEIGALRSLLLRSLNCLHFEACDCDGRWANKHIMTPKVFQEATEVLNNVKYEAVR